MSDPRSVQLAANLQAVRRRVAAACSAAGRRETDVTLVAVTKTFPAADVARLAALGVGDFGENRDQEARAKAAAVPAVRWHFVGRLQRNKCRSVVGYADAVHSVDRPELAELLAREAERAGRRLAVFVQVSLDPAGGGRPGERGGVAPAGLDALADLVAGSPALRLLGVMAVAPPGTDPDDAYARLAGLAERLRATHPGADRLSAGMSGDLEAAIRHGATHLRIGTALLGGRAAVLR